jgi:hypothetical protein
MANVSSMAHLRFELINGETAPGAHVTASLRVGETGDNLLLLPEFSITDACDRSEHGRLTWDADHRRNGPQSRFFSVAAVRLDVKANGECLLAVGTGPFVRFTTAPYHWVERVQVAAAAGTLSPQRLIQWDWMELDLCHADGHVETRQSSCLPRAATGLGLRRAAQAGVAQPRAARQYVQLTTGTRNVVDVKLRGQVTLRANDSPSGASPLGPEDLLGGILVFTDAPARRSAPPVASR